MKSKSIFGAVAMAAVVQALAIPPNVDALQTFNALLTVDLEANTAGHKNAAAYEPAVPSVAPLHSNDREKVPHSYIITFKDSVSETHAQEHKSWVLTQHMSALSTLDHEFFSGDSGLVHSFDIGSGAGSYRGYSGVFHPHTIDLIRAHPDVAFVERDSIVNASEYTEEGDAPWGLARISHRDGLNLGTFNKYIYDSDGGEGVTAYVIDTGVYVKNEDFGGRAKWGATIPEGDIDEDANGHGTHCAGTIAGTKYGVAKKAKVVAVKVLKSDGSGTMSDVIGGVVWAARRHNEQVKKNPKGFKGSTANMSLGGGFSSSLNLAVDSAVKAGIHFAVAAGNDNTDACGYSPASSKKAITVGASALSDARAYFSNLGRCVDIFAPGLNILSTYIGSPQSVATLSGTSMASPHIAGLLSYYLSLQPKSDSQFATSAVTPAQLKKNLIAFASKDLLTDVDRDTPNVLAFNGGGKSLKKFWKGKSSEEEEVNDDNMHESAGQLGSIIVGIRKLMFGF